MRWWIDRRVTAALFLILLLLLSMGIVSYGSLTSFHQTTQWVQRSQSGIMRLESLLTQLVAAETGQRGYLLTGDYRYLRPYLTAIESIQHRLDTLETLTQDNPMLQQHLVRLKPLISYKFAELEETIVLRDGQGYEAAMELVRTHQGQQVMESIQSIVHSMKAEAQATFAQRSQISQAYSRRIWLLLSVESITVAVLLALVVFQINRDVSCYHRILENLQTAETTFWRAILDAPLPVMLTPHRLEEELEQRVAERTADLEQANAALEAFSRTVAHDLYAPLRTIQSFAAILLEDTSKLNLEEQNSLQRIYSASQRMEAFIRDLLTYSRLERVDLPLQPVNLDRILKQVLSDLEDTIHYAEAQIDWPQPLGIVHGHPIAIEQILTNLLTNAIKFVPVDRSPQICIWTEAVADAAVIRLTVQDNGIGIAAEDQERIFSIFERLHPAELFPGSGIGLAIVSKAIERMHGRVGVESKPGQGSRFWLELPTKPGSVERISGGQS